MRALLLFGQRLAHAQVFRLIGPASLRSLSVDTRYCCIRRQYEGTSVGQVQGTSLRLQQGTSVCSVWNCVNFFCTSAVQYRRKGDGMHYKAPKGSEESALNIDPKTEIQLLGQEEESLGTMTLKRAEKLAENKGLKLVLIDEKNKLFPVFRLMTGHQLVEERKRQSERKKMEKSRDKKTLVVSSKISAHDLEVKCNHLIKWLEKGHHVKVTIKHANGNREKSAADIFNHLTTSTSEVAEMKRASSHMTELSFTLHPRQTTAEHDDTHADNTLKPLRMEDLKKMRDDKE